MKILGFVLSFSVCASTYANPVAWPAFVMTAENVLVGVSTEGIYVAGTYRFHTLPYPGHPLENTPILGWIDIPIPVPESEKIDSELMAELNPELSIGEKKFLPTTEYKKFARLPRVAGVKFMSVTFLLGRISSRDVEMVIKYSQPIIKRDGRLWAYYMPLLGNYESYEKKLGLRHSSYIISFEAVKGASLSWPRSEAMTIIQSGPKLVSFEAHDEELLGVEIVPNHSQDQLPAPGTSPGMQEPRHD